MPSYVTPKKNSTFIFYLSLVSQADTKLFQSNPTLAAGDVKVSTDGGAFANLGTLPTVTPASGRGVKVTLSASEMNGDNILVVFSDAAGAEWCDLSISIQTSANQIDDLLDNAAISELAQATPPANPTPKQAMMLPYMAMRNKFTVSTTARKIHNDAGTAIVSQTISDNGTTYTQDEAVSGP